MFEKSLQREKDPQIFHFLLDPCSCRFSLLWFPNNLPLKLIFGPYPLKIHSNPIKVCLLQCECFPMIVLLLAETQN